MSNTLNLTVNLIDQDLIEPFRDYDRSDLYATIVACYANARIWTPWQYVTAVTIDLGDRECIGLRDFPITINSNTNYLRLGLCQSLIFVSNQPVALDTFDQEVEGWEGYYRVTHPLVYGRRLRMQDQSVAMSMRYFMLDYLGD